nr:rod shape-determining protein MreD [Sedimentibacter sp.]
MKKINIIVILVITNFIFQTSLYNYLDIFGIIPNISLIFVVIFAMMTNGILGGFIGILTGFLYDVMIYDVFGVYTLIYFVIGALIGYFSEEVNKENYTLYSLVTLMSTLFFHILLYIMLFFLKYNVENIGYIIKNILLQTILNTLVSIFVLKFVVYLFNKINVK